MECGTAKKLDKVIAAMDCDENRLAELELKTELLQVQIRNLYEYIGSQVKLEDIEP